MRSWRVRSVSQLGAAVREARDKAGLTQQQLADKAGVSRRWLSTLENGQNLGAELTKVFRAVDALGLELSLGAAPAPTEHEAELLDLLDRGTGPADTLGYR